MVSLVLILVQAMMASLAIVGKIVLREIPAPVLVLVRVVGAAAVLAIAHRMAGQGYVRNRRDLLSFALLGLLGISVNQSLFLLGLGHTTAINATVLVATVPVFTVLISLLLHREAPSILKISGILIAAAGAVYLIGPDRISLAPNLALGNALILVAMVAYAAYLVLARRMLDRYRTLTASLYVMLFGALGVVPFGVVGLGKLQLGNISASIWALVGYIVLVPTILSYFLNIWALRRASSNLVAGFIYLQPVLTAFVAPLLLEGEHITSRTAIAAGATFIGLGLVIWGELAQRAQVPVDPMVGE